MRAVVSGASSGIGLAVACRLHDDGAEVLALARRAAAIEAGAGPDRLASGRFRAASVDVTDPAAVRAAASDAPLDVLVAAAGTNVKRRRLDQLSAEDVDAMLQTNTAGVIHLVSAYLPALRAARGLVVVVGSVSGSWPDVSGPAYQASKGAVRAFCRGAGFEEHEHGVRFTILEPGVVDTPLLDRRPAPPDAETRARMLTPDDLAEVIAFLAHLPARVHIPELTVLPSTLQVLGRTF
jgi:NADP-dependent 3-hydroxy acid dehydrogenase YdfG